MQFKLRAECSQDVAQFISLCIFEMKSFKMVKDKALPDVEFEFETDLSQEEIMLQLMSIEDAHVMHQTLKPIEVYTGERDYSL